MDAPGRLVHAGTESPDRWGLSTGSQASSSSWGTDWGSGSSAVAGGVTGGAAGAMVGRTSKKSTLDSVRFSKSVFLNCFSSTEQNYHSSYDLMFWLKRTRFSDQADAQDAREESGGKDRRKDCRQKGERAGQDSVK